MTNNNNFKPRIYVACLAAYNNGYLHGRWIDATQDEKAIWKEASAMLAESPIADAEEWAIHDYDDFGGLRPSEWESFADISKIARLLVEYGKLGIVALDHYQDVDYTYTALEEYYCGEWDSVANYAQHLTEEMGLLNEIPPSVRYYIDYKSMARDMEYGGEIISLEDVKGNLHIFTSH